MKIKVVTAYRGECAYRKEVTANLTEYCDRWGYSLVTKFDDFQPLSKDFWLWTKQQVIMAEFHDCDWLLWVDADCMVLNMTIPLTAFIDAHFDLGVTGPWVPTCLVVDCQYRLTPCHSAGIMLMRNCQWCHDLLKKWWASKDVNWRPKGCIWLGDSAYLSCRVMRDPAEMRHIRVFPLKEIGWANLANDPSQFLMHFYGGATPQQFHFHESYVIR